jgi:copper chaperone CopZ
MKATITVEGMHCNACEMLITDALGDTPGVKSANVSLKEGKAVVEYDERQATETQLRKVIEDEGYKTR